MARRSPTAPRDELFALVTTCLLAKRASPAKIRRAQDFGYDAWERETHAETLSVMREVLSIDPWHIDALLFVLDASEADGTVYLDALERIVELGEKALGTKLMRESIGYFWGVFETRPYMRARATLALALRDLGEIEAAIDVLFGSLVLNPNDNQGLRYELLPMILALGEVEAAALLIERYAEDGSPCWFWCRTLERFLCGDVEQALKTLRLARTSNRNLEKILLTKAKLPPTPGVYGVGSLEEAHVFASWLRLAWRANPKAFKWLQGQLKAPRRVLRVVK